MTTTVSVVSYVGASDSLVVVVSAAGVNTGIVAMILTVVTGGMFDKKCVVVPYAAPNVIIVSATSFPTDFSMLVSCGTGDLSTVSIIPYMSPNAAGVVSPAFPVGWTVTSSGCCP